MSTRAEEIAAEEYPKSKGANRIHPDVFRAEGFTNGYKHGQQDRWISIKDGVPERVGPGAQWFLVTDGELFDVALLLKGGFLGHRQLDATHYTPLPSPPNPEQP